MSKGGKQFLGWLFMVLAIAAWLGWVPFDYFDYWFSPTAQVVLTAAAFIMFKMASSDKTAAGLAPDPENGARNST